MRMRERSPASATSHRGSDRDDFSYALLSRRVPRCTARYAGQVSGWALDVRPQTLGLTCGFVRPLGFEPRTCGLDRVRTSHGDLDVSDVRFCLTACRSSRSSLTRALELRVRFRAREHVPI